MPLSARLDTTMPPKKGKKMSGRAAARLQTQESIKSSLSSSTIMARMAQRRVLLRAISSSFLHNNSSSSGGMIYDLIVIIVQYAESKVSYSIVGSSQADNSSLFFLTLSDGQTSSSLIDTTKGGKESSSSSAPTAPIAAAGIPQLTPWRRPPSAISPTGGAVYGKAIWEGTTCAILPFIVAHTASLTDIFNGAVTPATARLARAAAAAATTTTKTTAVVSGTKHDDDDDDTSTSKYVSVEGTPSTSLSLCYAGGPNQEGCVAISLTDDAPSRKLAQLHEPRFGATSTVLYYDQWFVAGNLILILPFTNHSNRHSLIG
jgi:hypothetical protein